MRVVVRSADGLNDLLLIPDDPEGDWRKPYAVLHRDAVMMAVVRVSILLDRDDVSFQAIHRLLKDPSVIAALLQALEDQHGSDVYSPSRTELIEEFRQIYGEIDWKVHGRLVHLRNLGIAHLTPEEMTKSVTFDELRTMVEVRVRLTSNLTTPVPNSNGFSGGRNERVPGTRPKDDDPAGQAKRRRQWPMTLR